MARYMELRRTLAAEIAAGRPPVGARFPTDLELCGRFGVSRHTVREALRELQDQGLLVRQRGAGTVVAAPAGGGRTPPSPDQFERDLAGTRFEPAAQGVLALRGPLAATLEAREGSRWLRLAGLRRPADGGAPLAWMELFVAEPFLSARRELAAGDAPIQEQLRRLFGVSVSEVEQRLSADVTPAALAAALEAPTGGPALVVRRRYFTAGAEPVAASLSLFPGQRYAYLQRLSGGAA